MEDFQQYLRLTNNCDPSDPLLSITSLGEQLNNIPLSSVDRADLNHLTQVLNLEQLIPTEAGLARDYRGLAERMGFSSIEIENCIKRSYNPTRSLIDAFIKGNKDITLNDLLKLIEDIERFDVIDDIMPTLVKLATDHHQLEISFRNDDNQLHPGPSMVDCRNEARLLVATNDRGQQQQLEEFKRLTIDDMPHSVVIIYDAFVCYAPEDMHHAKELIDFLEANDKSVATADDLLPGYFEHDSLVRLIDDRCRKVIIILTPNFSRSKECEFQQKFASEIGIKADCPKIIPVLYEFCEDSMMPSMIKVLSKIDMTNQAFRDWQLNKLIRSLSDDRINQPAQQLSSSSRHNSFHKRLIQFSNSSRMNSNNTEGRQIAATNSNEASTASHQEPPDLAGPVPAITFSKKSVEASDHHHICSGHNSSSTGPIIDILQSENSGELEIRRQQQAMPTNGKAAAAAAEAAHGGPNESQPNKMAISSNSTTNNPINWLKKQVTRRVWRNEPGDSTSTSRLILITDSADSNADGDNYQQPHLQQINGGT